MGVRGRVFILNRAEFEILRSDPQPRVKKVAPWDLSPPTRRGFTASRKTGNFQILIQNQHSSPFTERGFLLLLINISQNECRFHLLLANNVGTRLMLILPLCSFKYPGVGTLFLQILIRHYINYSSFFNYDLNHITGRNYYFIGLTHTTQCLSPPGNLQLILGQS